jgi:hypothetical protein
VASLYESVKTECIKLSWAVLVDLRQPQLFTQSLIAFSIGFSQVFPQSQAKSQILFLLFCLLPV